MAGLLGKGMVPHSAGLRTGRESRSPPAGCCLQPGLWDFCRDHPCFNEEHPFTGASAFSPEKTSLGRSVFNPRVSPHFPKFGTASPQRQGPRQSCRPGSLHMPPQLRVRGRGDRARNYPQRPRSGPLRAAAAALPPQTCLSASSAGTNLPYVSANRGNCWNQCLIGFRLWQTACRYIFLCQSRRGRRGARELGDAEWK